MRSRIKLFLNIVLLLAPLSLIAQRDLTTEKYKVSQSNHAAYYQHVLRLIEYKDYDSSCEATRVMRALMVYDTSTYSYALYTPLVDKIEAANFRYFREEIIGTWNFRWSGSNWGAANTPNDLIKKLIFTSDEILFYSGDTLTRKSRYRITHRPDVESHWWVSRAAAYYISLEDSGEIWSFRLNAPDKFVPYIGRSNTTALWVNMMYNCVCGCPEVIYSKSLDL
ncbi:MAG: hypothetical protein WCF67_00760 [Chitinophagaceae bacterium]